MKQNLKQIIALFAISSLIILSGCTQEKDFVNEHNHPNIDFKEKSFKEALSMPIFNDAYQKVAKRKSDFKSSDEARTALEDQFGFTIVADSPIRIVTNENGTIFYTILIEREVKEELVFENLMIKVENNETTAAIFKYSMTEKGTSLGDNNYVLNGISSTEYTDLNIDSRVFYNAGGETCSIINVLLCDTADHRPAGHIATSSCWNGNGNTIYFGTALACVDNEQTSGGGADGDPGGPSSNNTGGVGASGGSTDPVVVSPIPCKTGNCMEADVPVDPCDTLEEIFDPQKMNIEGILSTLIQNSENREVGEEGYSFQRKIASNGTVSFPNEIHRDGGESNVVLDVGFDIFGCIHIHPISLVNMFSFADIFDIDRFYRAASDDNKKRIIYMLVTEDGNIYAMQLDDHRKYRQFIQKYLYTPYMFTDLTLSEKIDKANQAFNEELIKNSNSTPQNLQKRFAKLIENSGLNFYRLDGYAPRVWKKIKAGENDNSDPIVTSPCN